MVQTKTNLVYCINKANKTDFHLVYFISGPTLVILKKVIGKKKLTLHEFYFKVQSKHNVGNVLMILTELNIFCLSYIMNYLYQQV